MKQKTWNSSGTLLLNEESKGDMEDHSINNGNLASDRNANFAGPKKAVVLGRPVVVAPINSSAGRIRSRFLHRLGLCERRKQGTTSSSHVARSAATHPAEQFYEPLKGDYGIPDDSLDESETVCSSFLSSSSAGGASSTSAASATRSVSFAPAVAVRPIPSRQRYSDRIRASLWMDPVEMRENAARNNLEFMAEGRDWRAAAEEDDMVVICGTGERVHPVHFYGQEYSWQRAYNTTEYSHVHR